MSLQQTVETFRKYAAYFHAQENRYLAGFKSAHLALHEREDLIADAVMMKDAVSFHDQAWLVDCFN
jgi:hypothetical protein